MENPEFGSVVILGLCALSAMGYGAMYGGFGGFMIELASRTDIAFSEWRNWIGQGWLLLVMDILRNHGMKLPGSTMLRFEGLSSMAHLDLHEM